MVTPLLLLLSLPARTTAHSEESSSPGPTLRGDDASAFLRPRGASPQASVATAPLHAYPSASRYELNVSLTTLADFLSFFTFDNQTDVSGGINTYTTREEAEALNLFGPGSLGGIRISADVTERNKTRGRRSVRLRGSQEFQDGVFAWNVASAPTGCGVWPALWVVGYDSPPPSPWPQNGEIDIFEYGNGRSRRPYTDQTLHLNGTCVMPPPSERNMTGTTTGYEDCDSFEARNGNHGCGVTTTNDLATGPGFNANGGGWFVAERREGDVKLWVFPQCRVPSSLQSGGAKIDTSQFGKPSAHFPSTPECDLREKFGPIHPVANIAFCGTAQLYWRDDGCLAVAPDCYSWQATDNATDYYIRTKSVLDMDITSFAFYQPI